MSTNTNRYGFGIVTDLEPAEAEFRLRAALAVEGFGILTEIDVSATLKQKLDVDWVPYRILGACNPTLAYQALGREESIGLLLPCKVVVYRRGPDTAVEILDPSLMVELTGNPELQAVAAEARARLERALSTLPSKPSDRRATK